MSMTLREIDLAWRARSDWDRQQTAELLAAIYNIRPRGKGDPKQFKGSDFYQPISEEKKQPSPTMKGTRLTVGLLKALKGKMFQN